MILYERIPTDLSVCVIFISRRFRRLSTFRCVHNAFPLFSMIGTHDIGVFTAMKVCLSLSRNEHENTFNAFNAIRLYVMYNLYMPCRAHTQEYHTRGRTSVRINILKKKCKIHSREQFPKGYVRSTCIKQFMTSSKRGGGEVTALFQNGRASPTLEAPSFLGAHGRR